jgi:hypothetical protein
MDRCVGAAALLAESDRRDLAIEALTRSATISDLSARHGVSRKFIYQQTGKARTALDDAFLSTAPDDEVVFELTVTKTWLRQVIVGLTLICRSSYRGVVEFLRDLLGVSISIGTVHHVLEWAAQQAGIINHDQDLSGIRVGLHDELFQGAMPVLAGVDATSTYCYLLAAAERRDADTWGVHLLDAARQGLRPDYTIADAGQGLRAGQKAAWDDTPCHGDVFHIQHQCEGLTNTLSRLAKGATSRREKLEARIDRSSQPGSECELVIQVELARQPEARAGCLARDIRLLTQWLSHDVLALAGPTLVTRQILFDFIVTELQRREPVDERRIRPVRVALQNQRDDLYQRPRPMTVFCDGIVRNTRSDARTKRVSGLGRWYYSLSPPCLMRSWPPSPGLTTYPRPSCVKHACCIACRAPRPPIGRGGTGFEQNSATTSTPSSTR